MTRHTKGPIFDLLLDDCQAAAARAGWSPEQWEQVRDEMLSADHAHLVDVVRREFGIIVD